MSKIRTRKHIKFSALIPPILARGLPADKVKTVILIIKTMSNKKGVRRVYNELSDDYLSPSHRTVSEFNALQQPVINHHVERFLNKTGIDPETCTALIIGGGPGQHVLDLAGHDSELRIPFGNFVEVDLSEKMLIKARKRYLEHIEKSEIFDELPLQVQDDALSFLTYARISPDIVIAGLCDHIHDQQNLYKMIFNKLKDGGLFIATYPHKDLMDIIRKCIYDIPDDMTQYRMPDGSLCVIESYPQNQQTSHSLDSDGFYSETIDLYPSMGKSKTIDAALEISDAKVPAVYFKSNIKMDYFERRGLVPEHTISGCHSISI